MAEQLILAAAAATTLAPHVAHTVSKAVSALVHSVQVARDRHQDAQNIGFQTWIKNAEQRSRLYYEQGPTSPVSWVFTHGTEIPNAHFTSAERLIVEVFIEFYEVLVADESAVRWETATYPFYVRTFNGGTLVEGGHEHDGSPLFLARAFYWGGTHPGKTSSYLKGADITFAGKEYVVKDFQVLVYNTNPSITFACIEELD
ncbi:hypothetical protein FRC10_004103 [Ceratobasidium sp. 414]|nr:hypothetical protein FRC10_004103 [Ceratobasidium sp. 414]